MTDHGLSLRKVLRKCSRKEENDLDINVKFAWVRSPMYWCLRTLFKYRQLRFFLVILRRHQSIYQCKICFGSPKYWWLRILFKYRHPSFSSCHQTTSTCKEQHQRRADVWNRIFTNMKIIFTTTKWNFHIKYTNTHPSSPNGLLQNLSQLRMS